MVHHYGKRLAPEGLVSIDHDFVDREGREVWEEGGANERSV